MDAKPVRVPIFPLAGAILFPRAQLPLHVFEDRYRSYVQVFSADAIAELLQAPVTANEDVLDAAFQEATSSDEMNRMLTVDALVVLRSKGRL